MNETQFLKPGIINHLIEETIDLTVLEALQFVSSVFPGKVKFSTAFGREGQVLLDTIFRNDIDISIFTIDTGRLFQETYEVIDKTRARYKKPIEVYYPKTSKVQDLTKQKGFHSFYESLDDRRECCFIRKVEQLQRALADTQIWVTGLRAGQSQNRENFNKVEWDESNQVIKFNPILDWSQEQVLAYLEEYNVPTNTLFEKGFGSIGCAPCTRPIEAGEHPRAGRWWWEDSQKECGLHQVKKKVRSA